MLGRAATPTKPVEPTFSLSQGRLILLSVTENDPNHRVTLQDDKLLEGTKLRLSSNRVSLGFGDSMLLYCDGYLWYEIGRRLAPNQTSCVAYRPGISNPVIFAGHIVAAVHDPQAAAAAAIPPGSAPATVTTRWRNADLASANGAGTRRNPIGASVGDVQFNGEHFDVQSSGEMHVPDNVWVGGVPAVTDVGKPVYLSETAGSWTMTAPTSSGSTVVRMGTITVGGAGLVMVLIKIGDPTVNP